MDILQLEHFLAVAEEGTFRRAAERVYRTQPAVSQSVKKLEEEIGAPLFARDMHDLTLTPAGNMLLDYARRLVSLRNEATRQLLQLKGSKVGTLTVSAHESAALYLLPPAFQIFLTRFSDMKISICRSRLEDIPRQVLDRDVQIGFVKDEPILHGLQCVEVHTDTMVLISSPRNEIASRQQVDIRELDQCPFIVHHMCSSTEEVLLRLFDQHDTTCRIIAELCSFENVKTFVKANLGFAVVPRITVTEELKNKELVAVNVKELNIRRRTLMLYPPDYLSDSAQQLMSIVLGLKNDSTAPPLPADVRVPHGTETAELSA